MFEQDYIMRQIHQIIKVLVKILFNVDDNTPYLSLIQDSKSKETAGNLLSEIDSGNIIAAVDELLELIEKGTMNDLLIGIVFYSYLNGKDDDYLETNGFSRDNVENGIKYLLSEYGLEDISNIFFYD